MLKSENFIGKYSPVTSALKSLRFAAIAIFTISFFLNLLLLTGPLYMLQIYDRVLASGSIQTLVVLSVFALMLYCSYWVLDVLRSRVMLRVANTFDDELNESVFACDVKAPLKLGKSGLLSEPVRELERIRLFVGGRGLIAFFDLMWAPLFFTVMFMFHVWLGILAVTGGLILFLLAVANEFVTRRVNREMALENQIRSSFVSNVRQNIEAVSALGMMPNLAGRWAETNGSYIAKSTRVTDLVTWFSSASKTIRLVLQSTVLGLGAYLAVNQVVSPGVMIAASIIASRAVAPVEQVVANWPAFLTARQALARLQTTLLRSPPRKEKTPLPLPSESLSVSNLSAIPPGTNRPNLRGIRFDLVAGDAVGIVGPSASGKSSLARALVGVWPFSHGSIRFDNGSPDQWDPDWLGRAMGYLPQSVGLLEGTVTEIISRFDPRAEPGEVIDAAKIAGVHEMILGLPEGYDTSIGDDGTILSAGQRQRLALARALFRKPFLIVLDEPNSNLDVEGEAALNRAIKTMRNAGSIVFVVAHRNSALESVNKVLVLRNGRQVGFGSKDEIVKATSIDRGQTKEGLSVVHEA